MTQWWNAWDFLVIEKFFKSRSIISNDFALVF